MKKLLLLLPCCCGLLLSAAFWAHFAKAQQTSSTKLISSKYVGPFRYTMSSDDTGYYFKIQLPAELPPGAEKPRVFALRNPARIVIDVPVVGTLLAREDKLLNSKFSLIRVGEHPGKTRIVLDVRGQKPPLHLLDQDRSTGEYVAKFFFPLNRQTNPSQWSKPQPVKPTAPTKKLSRKYTKPTIRVRNVKTATLRKRSKTSPATRARMRQPMKSTTGAFRQPIRTFIPIQPAAYAPRPIYRRKRSGGFITQMVAGGVVIKVSERFRTSFAGDQAMLQAIRYKTAHDGSLAEIQLAIPGITGHKLRRADNNEYILRLAMVASIGASAKQAICPPGEESAVRAIVPELEKSNGGEDTELRIFVQPGVALEPIRRKNGLILRVHQN